MNRLTLVLASALALASCGQGSSTAPAASTSAVSTPPAPAADTGPSAADLDILKTLPAPYNTADLVNGRRQFAKCKSCHVIEKGGANRVGPALHSVFGRKAGTAPGFQYSDAVKNAGFIWDADKLNQWLLDPRGFLPGNRMSFAGIKPEADRRDVIAYIKVESAK